MSGCREAVANEDGPFSPSLSVVVGNEGSESEREMEQNLFSPPVVHSIGSMTLVTWLDEKMGRWKNVLPSMWSDKLSLILPELSDYCSAKLMDCPRSHCSDRSHIPHLPPPSSPN